MNSWQIIALISFVIILPVVAAVVMQAGPFWAGALLYVATIVTHVTGWVIGVEGKYRWGQETLAFLVAGEVAVVVLLVWSLFGRIEYGRRKIS
ncbi:hypothetical protein GWK78_01860 [Candidatus Saccharibacteria bacterium oral taxon 488]|nr:hypothetical protein GWK78_01860 [Candidatus Saccharibacteria bacterium oral taxon 488]